MMRTPFLVLARFSAQDVARLVGQRRVQRDEIRAGEQRVEIRLLYAHLDRALRREERIEGHDLHLEAERAAGDDAADVARADEAQRLAGDLDAHEAFFGHLPACVDRHWLPGSGGRARTSARWRARPW
jgi:hypothetical protein